MSRTARPGVHAWPPEAQEETQSTIHKAQDTTKKIQNKIQKKKNRSDITPDPGGHLQYNVTGANSGSAAVSRTAGAPEGDFAAFTYVHAPLQSWSTLGDDCFRFYRRCGCHGWSRPVPPQTPLPPWAVIPLGRNLAHEAAVFGWRRFCLGCHLLYAPASPPPASALASLHLPA